jgi:Retrotransposon gag protein
MPPHFQHVPYFLRQAQPEGSLRHFLPRGTPRIWANSILENEDHPYRKSFPEFKKALDAMYTDRNLKQRARDKLGHLEQTKSVASYSAEFQNIIAPLNLDDGSKQSMFYKGLDSDIKKSLIYFPAAKSFDELLE